MNSSEISSTSGEFYGTQGVGEVGGTSALVGVALGVALGVVTVVTVTGNGLVLVAIYTNRHLRGTTHYFIANLAVADLLLGVIVLPFSVSLEVTDKWLFGDIMCDVWAAVDVLCCTASIMSLCAISVDRYVGVTRPLQHSVIVTSRRALVVCLVVWLMAGVISVAPLFGWKKKNGDAVNDIDPYRCEVTKQLGYVLFSAAGSFYIPMVIIVAVYWRVYREALRQSVFFATGVKSTRKSQVTLRVHTGGGINKNRLCSRPLTSARSSTEQVSGSCTGSQQGTGDVTPRRSHQTVTSGRNAKFKREKKAAKTLGIVVGVFILCWLPFFVILPLEALCQSCRPPDWLFKVIFWLGYCNSTMNPLIYTCFSREFKRAFVRILTCKRPHRSSRHGAKSNCRSQPDKLSDNGWSGFKISRQTRSSCQNKSPDLLLVAEAYPALSDKEDNFLSESWTDCNKMNTVHASDTPTTVRNTISTNPNIDNFTATINSSNTHKTNNTDVNDIATSTGTTTTTPTNTTTSQTIPSTTISATTTTMTTASIQTPSLHF